MTVCQACVEASNESAQPQVVQQYMSNFVRSVSETAHYDEGHLYGHAASGV